MPKVTFHMEGMRVSSSTNMRSGHFARAGRVKKEKSAAYLTMLSLRNLLTPACIITLTRVAPRTLDDDNLRGALKSIRDGIARAMRVDDATPMIEWRYNQEYAAGRYAVMVEVRWEDTP